MTTSRREPDGDRYHAALAAAFVRGRLGAIDGEDDAGAPARLPRTPALPGY